ncbi:MAG: penicillin-binding protein activator LpoB [Gammaproteobacteria bacterium]|nr:penicillin-binding protein activator LpoB [Gammaproteobacteria bacterium]
MKQTTHGSKYQYAFAIIGLVGLLSIGLSGCAGKVERIDANSTTDLSGDWNDTDSRLVAEEMIKDALSHPWVMQFTNSNRRNPTVIVGTIDNKSHEHVNVETFVNDMARALINSGEVDFVANKNSRNELREERQEQDIHATEATRKAAGQEIGADFMLKGSINSIIDAVAKEQTRFYQVDLTLISLKDNKIVWVGQKKIKKAVSKKRVRL